MNFSFFPLLRKWFTWDVAGKKYLFLFFFLEPDIQPHPSCYMYYYSVSEKSYNFLHLTRHRRLINFICAGLNLFPQTSLRMSSKAESWPSSRLITTRSLKSRAAALLPKLKILLEEKKRKKPKSFSLQRGENLKRPCFAAVTSHEDVFFLPLPMVYYSRAFTKWRAEARQLLWDVWEQLWLLQSPPTPTSLCCPPSPG